MKTQDLSWLQDLVAQDCEFTNIGHILGSSRHRFVPITVEADLQHALTLEDIAGLILQESISIPENTRKGIIISQNPVNTALIIYNKINVSLPQQPSSIHKSVSIHQTAKIAQTNVSISRNTKIGENVVIHQGCKIGKNCVIGPNTIVGKPPLINRDGYKDDLIQGTIEIMDGVSIHANCLIERPLFNDTTTIGFCCHIDNRVTIHQGTTINDLSLITANSVIGEYAVIGKNCWVGLRSTIHRGVKIGDSCYITLGSTTTEDIPSGMIVKNNWKINRDRFKGMII